MKDTDRALAAADLVVHTNGKVTKNRTDAKTPLDPDQIVKEFLSSRRVMLIDAIGASYVNFDPFTLKHVDDVDVLYEVTW